MAETITMTTEQLIALVASLRNSGDAPPKDIGLSDPVRQRMTDHSSGNSGGEFSFSVEYNEETEWTGKAAITFKF